ncbi:septum site-determining protein MinC [Marinicellulosiphila megalodicopiae]|uniref:septum site-determining protein MinC n=1 Tax=Marinicellulosiphila megalodicopiae TaxID=2724896 RepID=UPI003BAE696E
MNQAFSFKSSLQAVHLIEFQSACLDEIYEKLQFIEKTTPNLIFGAPIVLNLEHIEQVVSKEYLYELLTMLKGFSMHPIAAQTSRYEIQTWLTDAGLASHKISQKKNANFIIEQKQELSTMFIETMDKQIVYAKNQHVMLLGDLPKHHELIADGNITVLGTIFGKVIAGAQKRTNSFVFAYQCQAQKISVEQTCFKTAEIPILASPSRFFIKNNRIEYAVFFQEKGIVKCQSSIT